MECVICMLSEEPTQTCPNCANNFHTSCLYNWGKQTCPRCLQPFEFFELLNTPKNLGKEIIASAGLMKKMIEPQSYPYLSKIKDILRRLRTPEFYDKLESLLPNTEEPDKKFLREHPQEWKKSTLYEYATRLSNHLNGGEVYAYQAMMISVFFGAFHNKTKYGIYKDNQKLFLTFAQLNT